MFIARQMEILVNGPCAFEKYIHMYCAVVGCIVLYENQIV